MAQRSPHPIATDDKPADAARDQQRNSNLARIRDNQRRSRARRKEYLEELEGRLRNCQQLGVEASAEIQAAARRVVDENKRLRQLLRRQGLSDAEIDGLPVESSPEASPHNTSAGALEGMLSARRTCNCDDSPGSGEGCHPGAPQESTSPYPSIANAGQYLAPRPQSNGHPRPLVPHPIPVSFQHLGTGARAENAVNGSSSSSEPMSFDHHHHNQQQQQHHHTPAPPQETPNYDPLPSHGMDYELGFDEPTGWLMNYVPAPSPSSALAAAAATTPGAIPDSPATATASAASADPTAGLLLNGNNNTSSCVAAADLIRTIKPDIELAELERELGCAHGGECKVPLTQIFSIMNRVAERGS